MSRLVLGGALFGRMDQLQVNQLLNVAFENGISMIDTAAGYPDSELRIGNYLNKRSVFSVNTKVGLPDPDLFTPKGITASVEKSLKDLKLERINTLFIHTLPKKHFTDENLGAMIALRDSGKVKRIGYSGDGNDLGAALQKVALDDFMFTFNIIDQSNFETMSQMQEHRNIYVKIPMAQGIWRSIRLDRQIASTKVVRLLFNKPPLPASWLDYKSRFKKFRVRMDTDDYPGEFLKFALYAGGGEHFVVLGANSIEHIESAVRIESAGVKAVNIAGFRSLWKELSQPTWLTHS